MLTVMERTTVPDVEVWPAALAGFLTGAVMEGPVYLRKVLGLPVKQNSFRTWGTASVLHVICWRGQPPEDWCIMRSAGWL